MIKSLIKQRFSKSLKSYNKCAIVQKQMAHNLFDMIENNSYNNILELGCGTGFVTRLVNDNIEYNCYDVIDIVENCEEYIKKISPRINFINTDIEKFVPERKYNLIISNAVLQWLENFPKFVNRLKMNLSENGILVFTMFGNENYIQLKEMLQNNIQYYSVEELKELFKDYEILKIVEDKNVLTFNNPKEVLHHIKDTGVNAINNESWTKGKLKEFEMNYPKQKNGCVELTYNPIYVVLKNN